MRSYWNRVCSKPRMIGVLILRGIYEHKNKDTQEEYNVKMKENIEVESISQGTPRISSNHQNIEKKHRTDSS